MHVPVYIMLDRPITVGD